MTDIAQLGLVVDSSGVVRATDELKKLERQGDKTEKGTTRATDKMTAAFKRVGKAGALAAVAIAGLVATNAARDVANFTAALSDLSAITGATGKDLEFYAENAKEIGRTTSLSASEAAAAFKLIASAKPDLLESSAALNQVTRDAVTLAEATGMALPEAAQALGSALNQFQIDASKSAEVINILAASSKLGTAEVASVTDALRNAGPAANSLGIDLAETVAGIQALAKAGRQGSDAGTALRQVMLKLERTADATLQPSVVGLTGALEELADRNLTNNELLELFGEEGFAAATALLSTRDTVDQLNVSLRGTETATEQAATRMDNLTGDTKELKSAIEGLSIEIGEGLEPALRKGTQALTDFINGLNEFLFGPKPDPFLEQKVSLRDLSEEMERVGQTVKQYRENIRNLESGGAPDAVIEAQKKQLQNYEAQLLSLAQKHEEVRKGIANGGLTTTTTNTVVTNDETDNSPSPVRSIEQALEEATIDTSSLMWDWSPVKDEFKTELEEVMIDSQAIMDEWAPKLFEEFPENAEKSTDKITEFTVQAARNMQDAMADGFFDVMQGNFGDLEQSFKATIDRMVANLLASQLMNFLQDEALSGTFGSFAQGIATDIAGARADGGPVSGGKTYLVGERGPELFTPSGSGNITPNHQLSGGNVSVYVTIKGNADAQTIRASASQAYQQLGNKIQRDMRRNN